MAVVTSEHDQDHDPGGEVWVGVMTPGTELPARSESIRRALAGAGATFTGAESHALETLTRVHSAAMLEWLSVAWDQWQRSGLPLEPGQNRVVPYLFPHPGFIGDVPLRMPRSAASRAGRFAYDTMTLIGPGTWEAARGATDAALTAADLVLAGRTCAYALCRPPGHHATRDAYGGSCYLNNAAVAAAHLRDEGGGKVAVIDIDAHHGNGTQSIFFEDANVLTASVHVDPGAGWFPHYLGFENETGNGKGEGTNLNLPLEPGSSDRQWLDAVSRAGEWAVTNGAGMLVIALGVDAAAGDPESPLAVTPDGFRQAGKCLGSLGLPTVFVQEGGYQLDTLGSLVAATLTGFENY